jgi:hypothetical protein
MTDQSLENADVLCGQTKSSALTPKRSLSFRKQAHYRTGSIQTKIAFTHPASKLSFARHYSFFNLNHDALIYRWAEERVGGKHACYQLKRPVAYSVCSFCGLVAWVFNTTLISFKLEQQVLFSFTTCIYFPNLSFFFVSRQPSRDEDRIRANHCHK